MSRTIAVAALGFWHVHALEYAQAAAGHNGTELAVVWDDDHGRGAAAADGLGVPFEPDLDALLARQDIDAVTVTTSTDRHVDVISRALSAGKHVFTEKLLAPTVSECEELIALAGERRVSLFVSLPRLSEGMTVTAKRLVDHGVLGELTYGRVRMAHDGWIAGWLPERFADRREAIGGALTDLGCHPVYLTQLFFGDRPVSVSAEYGSFTGRDVEDNAVVVARYANGAVAVLESSFVTTPGASALELRGTGGSLLFGFGGERMLVKSNALDPDRWVEIPLDEARPSPFGQWVEHMTAATDATDNLHAAVELTRLVVAANESAERGQSVSLAETLPNPV